MARRGGRDARLKGRPAPSRIPPGVSLVTTGQDGDGDAGRYTRRTQGIGVTIRQPKAETLRQSEELFRLLVESVRDYAIFLLDPEGRITSWNAGGERLKGYRREEIVGRHFSVFYPPGDIAAGKPEEKLRIAAAEGRVEDEGWRVRKDGSQFWANVVLTALRDDTGTLIGFAKVTRDLTSRRQAEDARLHVAEERSARVVAEMMVRERDEFLSVAAHELKTPVTSLRGFAQLLIRQLDRNGGPDPTRLRQAAQAIVQQSGRLTRLVEHLLDNTRIEEGQLRLERTVVDINLLCEEIAQAAQLRTDQHAIVVVASERAQALVDALRVEQIIANLLDNAVKYSPQGGPIEMRITCDDQAVRIAVRDHGSGVPPPARERIFDRFHQVHRLDYRSGMGLGLHISRQIAELHGGTLEAEFPADGGTRFVLTLPRL